MAGDIPAFLARAATATSAGLRGILLRESRLDDGVFLNLALGLRRQFADCAGWLGVHDRVHLAAPAGADGVHLGYRSLEVDEVRPIVGEQIAIGLSTHAADEPDAWSGADYRFYGPVFETPSKRGLLAPVGPDGLTRSAGGHTIPVWALGGVNPENLPLLVDCGARGVAMLSGLLGAPDVAAATGAALDSWLVAPGREGAS